MNRVSVLILLFLMAVPVSAMNIEADPRTIISFMDRSISPELDILRVTTDISPDNHLVFQVKTKGEWDNGEDSDYLLLQILHEKNYALLIPLNEETEPRILIYEGDLQSENHLMSTAFSESEMYNLHAGFNVKRITRGAEFTVPLDWVNFGADFSFDAYTVQAEVEDNALQISKVYDQARKGRPEEKPITAITLLNNICSPKK
jgi:hypothetical protein